MAATTTEARTITSMERRAASEWKRICREDVEVEDIKGALYGYCSELAALRLAYKYRGCGDRVRAGYSENLQTWYFMLEPAHFTHGGEDVA
jgi:hypothetical protein